MSDGLFDRFKAIVGAGGTATLSPARLKDLRQQMEECAEAKGGEVSAHTRAARLAESYLTLQEAGRRAFLRLLALEFGPDPKRVEQAHADYQAAIGSARHGDAEAGLRDAMRARRRTWSSLGASNGKAMVYVTLGPDPPTTASSLNFSAADLRLESIPEASFSSNRSG